MAFLYTLKIKKGDHVVIITGKDKGKKGDVIRSFPEENTVVVEKANMIVKHVKAKGNVSGGRISMEAPIDASNVKLICPETKKSTRIGYQIGSDKKKYRIAKVSGVNVENPFVKK